MALRREEEEKIDTKNSGLPKFAPLVARSSLGPITKIVAYLSCSTVCTHFARTKKSPCWHTLITLELCVGPSKLELGCDKYFWASSCLEPAEKFLFIAPGLHSMFVLNKAAENYIYRVLWS